MRRPTKQLPLAGENHHTIIGSCSFSDTEIMRISDMLLTPGIHQWTMPNVKTGRTVLWSFLTSLDYYGDIACITTSSLALPASVLPLLEYWKVTGYLSEENGYGLASFFAQECTHDFLWIERDEQLRHTYYYAALEQELKAWQRKTNMTVLYLAYE